MGDGQPCAGVVGMARPYPIDQIGDIGEVLLQLAGGIPVEHGSGHDPHLLIEGPLDDVRRRAGVQQVAQGRAEVIEHGRSGLLVQPGDVEGLAGALRATLDDPEVRERLGAQANARYRNHYDVLAYPERINAVFDLAEARPGLVSLATPCEEPRA